MIEDAEKLWATKKASEIFTFLIESWNFPKGKYNRSHDLEVFEEVSVQLKKIIESYRIIEHPKE